MTDPQPLDRLTGLLPAQFDEVVRLSGFPPAWLSSATAPQATRANELLRWAQQSPAQRERLDKALDRVVSNPPRELRLPDKRMHVPDGLRDAAVSRRLLVWVGDRASNFGADEALHGVFDIITGREVDSTGDFDRAAFATWSRDERWWWLTKHFGRDSTMLELRTLAQKHGVGELLDEVARLRTAILLNAHWSSDLCNIAERLRGMRPYLHKLDDDHILEAPRAGEIIDLFSVVVDGVDLSDEARQERVKRVASEIKRMAPRATALLVVGVRDQDELKLALSLRASMADGAEIYWLREPDPRATLYAERLKLYPVEVAADRYPRFVEELGQLAERAMLLTTVEAYAGALDQAYEGMHREAEVAFKAEDYETAQRKWSDCLEAVEGPLCKAPDSESLLRWKRRWTLNVATCALNLQRDEQAREIVSRLRDEVDVPSLRGRERANFAVLLALTGDVDRAEQVLAQPEDPGLEEEDRRRLAYAATRVSLARGDDPPEVPLDDPSLTLATAQAWMRRGNAAKAAVHALATLHGAEDRIVLASIAAEVLVDSLAQTIWEVPGLTISLPVEVRAEVVEKVEATLTLGRLAKLPLSLHRHGLLSAMQFAAISEDHNSMAGIEKQLRALDMAVDSSEFHDDVAMRALELARHGNLEDALALADTLTGAPWIQSSLKVDLLAQVERFDDALKMLLPLVGAYPRRAPLELRAAQLLLTGARADEALAHARIAFELMPGRGYRWVYVRCLQATGDTQSAWEALQPLLDRSDDQAERFAIDIAAVLDPEQGLSRLNLYIERHPQDWRFQLKRVDLLYKTGELEGAVREACRILDVARSELTFVDLRACAGLAQVLGGPVDTRVVACLQRVDATLRERFPDHPEAEALRMQLRVILGPAAPAAPIDMSLVEASGQARSFHVDEMTRRIHAIQSLHDAYARLYQQGDICFESFCRFTGEDPARLVVRIASLATNSVAVLVAPVRAHSPRPVESLRRARVLMGTLEVLLLQKLGILAAFIAWLREGGGKLVLFADVYKGFLQSVPNLGAVSQRDERKRLDSVRGIVNAPWVVISRESPSRSDETWAEHHGLMLVRTTSTTPWNIAALLETLRARNYLEPELVASIQNKLYLNVAEAWSDPIPPLAFEMEVLDQLYMCAGEAVMAALRSFLSEITVAPRSWARFEDRRRDLHERDESVILAREAVAALGVGTRERVVELWTHERPNLAALWAILPDTPDRATRERFRTAFAMGMSYRVALHDDPTLTLVTADFVTAGTLADRWRALKDTAPLAPFSGQWLQEKLPVVEPRLFTLDRLMDALIVEDARRQRLREELALMGMVTALDSAGVRKLARRWGSLRDGRPDALLSQMESAAKNIEHIGVVGARLHLAAIYAEAIWMNYASPEVGDIAPADLLQQLLLRGERLDEALPLRSLDMVFRILAVKMLRVPGEMYRRIGEDVWDLATDSPGTRLWRDAMLWCGPSHSRTIALGRGVRELLLVHADPATPPDVVRTCIIGALLLEILRGLDHSEGSWLHPALSAASILSALWEERPLAGLSVTVQTRDATEHVVSMEDVLQGAAAWLGTLQGALRDGAIVEYSHSLDGLHKMSVLLPVDAILLRADAEVIRRVAPVLANILMSHDGEGAQRLRRLGDAPEDMGLRHAYAAHAAVAPWRLVREDPAVMLAWWSLHRAALSGLHGLDALRATLSEPDSPAAESVRDLLRRRLDEGGAWRSPGVQLQLIEQALQLPGMLALETRLPRLINSTDKGQMEQIKASLEALEHPDDQAVGALVSHLHLLTMAVRRHRYVKLPDQQVVDLHTRLAMTISGLIEALLRPPSEGSLAWAEDAALRVCGRIVEDLARPGLLSLADGLWLTWRLYQWWCAQLDFVHPEVRKEALRKIQKHAPPLREDFPVDRQSIFDPFTSGRERNDRRLAAVLFALGAKDHALGAFPADWIPAGEPATLDISSSELEACLLKLAQRPLTTFEETLRSPSDLQRQFGWPISAAVPDLALLTLLSLDASAFVRLLPESRIYWIRSLGASSQRPPLDEELTTRLLLSLVALLDQLSPEERHLFADFLRGLDPASARTPLWCWLGFTALFDAGELEFEPKARALLERHISEGHDSAPELFGLFLIAVAKHSPERWVSEARRLLAVAPDPVPLAQAIGRLVTSGPRVEIGPAQDLLRDLAGEGPYRHDPRFRATLQTLGVDVPTGA